MAQHSLPAGDVVAHRHIAESSRCKIYGAMESWRHSHISCTMATCVWALGNELIAEHLAKTTEPSTRKWLFALMDPIKHKEFKTTVVTKWAI